MPRQLPSGVSQSTLDHFSSIPWTQPTISDPSFQILAMSRAVSHGGRGHTLSGKTWNTESTIKELISFWRPSSSSTPLVYPQPQNQRGELRRFYTFGSDLNAHPDTIHGGVTCSILDSTLGSCVEMSIQHPREQGHIMYTAQLNVTYKAPIKTPGTVYVKAWVTKMEAGGRKVWVTGVVEGESGIVYALAEGLWVKPKGQL